MNNPKRSLYRASGLLALVISLSMTPADHIEADEGMWTLDNFPTKTVAEKYGIAVDTNALGRLQLATTRLEGGCSGSFASPDGLVLTNHHCVTRCLSENSSADADLFKNGYVATDRNAELSCKSEQISVLIETEDVTSKIADATAGLDDEDANKTRKSTLTELESQCREESPETINQCESVSLYNGGQYFLYKYKRYDDVRLAFAPEAAIAAFGGDPDNFNFPRWCLDMSLLRVYEDGEPAQSPAYLPWKRSGANDDELVLVTGHPGSTQRLQTMAQLELLRDTELPRSIEYNAELRGRLIQFAKTGAEQKRVVYQNLQGVENGLKVRRNQSRALLDSQVFEARRLKELALREAVSESETLEARYGNAWNQIEQAIAEYRQFNQRFYFVERSAGFQGRLYGYARSLVRAGAEREKPESERLRAYTGNSLDKLKLRLLAPRPINKELEIVRLSHSLEKIQEALGPDDYFVKLVFGKQSADELALRLISASNLSDPKVREALWEQGMSAVETSDDPLIQLALAIDPEARQLRKRYDDKVEAPIRAAGEDIAAARFAIFGTSIYPDATFSLRASYGDVAGWQENGETVTPFTTLGEIYPRLRDSAPFALPPSWKNNEIADDTRFNLASRNDIIGGNSGSALTNADGQLVGLVFDGNIHSIIGSYFYDGSKNRTVSVHPSIMLSALEKIYEAKHLVEEIQVEK